MTPGSIVLPAATREDANRATKLARGELGLSSGTISESLDPFVSMNNSKISRLPHFVVGLSLAALLGLAGCGEPKPAETAQPKTESTMSTPALETTDQRVSYGIALNIGSNIARQGGLEVDNDAFLAGLQDGLKGADPRVSEADLQAAFAAIQQKAEAAAAKGSEANIAAGEKFLAENGKRAGVTTTASGLQYEVLKAGTGPKPTAQQTVKVHYHGTLIDGTVFDSSVQRGEPIEFPVTGVIPGWVEALQLMPVGSKWKLFIPQNLAYGPRATGKIPAGSALIFEVELLEAK